MTSQKMPYLGECCEAKNLKKGKCCKATPTKKTAVVLAQYQYLTMSSYSISTLSSV